MRSECPSLVGWSNAFVAGEHELGGEKGHFLGIEERGEEAICSTRKRKQNNKGKSL
jgi:hypothetical protein